MCAQMRSFICGPLWLYRSTLVCYCCDRVPKPMVRASETASNMAQAANISIDLAIFFCFSLLSLARYNCSRPNKLYAVAAAVMVNVVILFAGSQKRAVYRAKMPINARRELAKMLFPTEDFDDLC